MGWFDNPASVDAAKIDRFVQAQDRLGIGGAFWVWKQGCGHPETADDAVTAGDFIGLNCATGVNQPVPAAFADPLSRAYPMAVPGRVTSLTSSVSQASMTLIAVTPIPEPTARSTSGCLVPGSPP
jgi:hypothetical protein